MNFVGHIVVADRSAGGASTAHLLGAAAPDLARMARLPVAPEGPADFRAGVAEHHRADAAFHDSDWFRHHNRSLVELLGVAGVRRGPARGAAHVLIELLLDGALLERAEHSSTFAPAWDALARVDDDALAMVPVEDHAHWQDFLGQLTSRLDPWRYADPVYAAERTAGTLSWRPRLAMTNGEVDILRRLAGGIQTSIVVEADEVVSEMATA